MPALSRRLPVLVPAILVLLSIQGCGLGGFSSDDGETLPTGDETAGGVEVAASTLADVTGGASAKAFAVLVETILAGDTLENVALDTLRLELDPATGELSDLVEPGVIVTFPTAANDSGAFRVEDVDDNGTPGDATDDLTTVYRLSDNAIYPTLTVTVTHATLGLIERLVATFRDGSDVPADGTYRLTVTSASGSEAAPISSVFDIEVVGGIGTAIEYDGDSSDDDKVVFVASPFDDDEWWAQHSEDDGMPDVIRVVMTRVTETGTVNVHEDTDDSHTITGSDEVLESYRILYKEKSFYTPFETSIERLGTVETISGFYDIDLDVGSELLLDIVASGDPTTVPFALLRVDGGTGYEDVAPVGWDGVRLVASNVSDDEETVESLRLRVSGAVLVSTVSVTAVGTDAGAMSLTVGAAPP